MKSFRLIFIFSLLTLLMLGCSKDPKTELEVAFAEHPAGGYLVSDISAKVKARLKFTEGKKFLLVSDGSPRAINLKLEWWAESMDKSNKMVWKSEAHTINSEDYKTIETSISAPDSMIFYGYFKVKALWEDDKGSHSLDSEVAKCTKGGMAKEATAIYQKLK